jgi:hypothetical protein
MCSPAFLFPHLFCPEKPGPLGQVRVLRLCLGVLCLKSQIPSTKLQINLKFQAPNIKLQTGSLRAVGKAIIFLFGILNLGHAQRRRLRRVL